MKHENIQENRINYIETKTKKIKKTYIPDIGIDILKRLIDKKTHPIKEKNKDSTKVVKQITAQYFNREIKEICKMANINSLEPVRTQNFCYTIE